MSPRQYTDKQMHVEKLINNMGFRTELEISYPPYVVDIDIPEIGFVVEIDGPQHYEKATQKRDNYLLERYGDTIMEIIHVPSDISDADFKKILQERIDKTFGNRIRQDS